MLSYLARQSVFFYPLSMGLAVVAAVYVVVTGRWTWLAVVIVVAVLSWFQYLFAKGWTRLEEDNDVRDWLRENPGYEPDEDGRDGNEGR
jgi:hypothetical protein